MTRIPRDADASTDPRAIIDRLDRRTIRQRTALLRAWATPEPADTAARPDGASDRKAKGTHSDPAGAATQADADARRRVWRRLATAVAHIGAYTIDQLGHPTDEHTEHARSLADVPHQQQPDVTRHQLRHMEHIWRIHWQRIATAVHTEAARDAGFDNARAIAQDAAWFVDDHGRACTLAVRTLTRPEHSAAGGHPRSCNVCDRPLDARTDGHATTCILCTARLDRMKTAASLCTGDHRPGCLRPLSDEDRQRQRRNCGPCRTWASRQTDEEGAA